MIESPSVAPPGASDGPSLPSDPQSQAFPANEEQLLVEHEPLVVMVAGWYEPRGRRIGFDREDLQQEARLAFLFALRTFDPEHGVPFFNYAVIKMKYALCSVLRDNAGGLLAFSRRFLEEGKQPPQVITETDARAFGLFGECDLDGLFSGDADEQRLRETGEWLQVQMRDLTPLQRDTILLRHVAELTGEQTAQVMGITPDAVDYHAKRGLTLLRAAWIAEEEHSAR